MYDLINLKIASREKLSPEFKAVVKKARKDLLQLQEELNKADQQKIPFEELKNKYYPLMEEVIVFLLREPDRLAQNFNLEAHLIHKDFYRDQLGPLLWPAPLHNRALAKPLGYAGDYVIMNMLYDEAPFHGSNSFFKLVHAASCQSISGKAVAARPSFLIQKITQKVEQNTSQNKDCHIMSLGCGPAKEIENLIKTNPKWPHCEVHLVDQDREAINYCKSILEKIKQEEKSSIKLIYHTLSVKEMFNPDLMKNLPHFDLIYSSGLFDYLSNDFFAVVLIFLYELLKENGWLVIGNFSPEAYAKTGLWYLDDWPLVYRSSEELLQLIPPSLKPQSVAIETEETGVNLFLVIKKFFPS